MDKRESEHYVLVHNRVLRVIHRANLSDAEIRIACEASAEDSSEAVKVATGEVGAKVKSVLDLAILCRILRDIVPEPLETENLLRWVHYYLDQLEPYTEVEKSPEALETFIDTMPMSEADKLELKLSLGERLEVILCQPESGARGMINPATGQAAIPFPMSLDPFYSRVLLERLKRFVASTGGERLMIDPRPRARIRITVI